MRKTKCRYMYMYIMTNQTLFNTLYLTLIAFFFLSVQKKSTCICCFVSKTGK